MSEEGGSQEPEGIPELPRMMSSRRAAEAAQSARGRPEAGEALPDERAEDIRTEDSGFSGPAEGAPAAPPLEEEPEPWMENLSAEDSEAVGSGPESQTDGAEIAEAEEPDVCPEPGIPEEPDARPEPEFVDEPAATWRSSRAAPRGTAEAPAVSEPSTEQAGSEADGVVDALRGMVSFFTIIRLPIGEKEMKAMETRFWLAPLVGLFNGTVAFVVCALLALCGVGVMVQAAAAIATVYVFSKFLHFDGLADFGDGMVVSSGRREDHVRALKDSLVGAGALGVSMTVLLLTFAAYSEVSAYCLAACFVALPAEVLVKNSMVAAAAFGAPGTGMASRQVAYADRRSLLLSTVVTAAVVAALWPFSWAVSGAMFDYRVFDEAWIAAVALIAAVLASVLVGWLMARVANRTFGFVNGDILGATNEISRAAVLLLTAIVLAVAVRGPCTLW